MLPFRKARRRPTCLPPPTRRSRRRPKLDIGTAIDGPGGPSRTCVGCRTTRPQQELMRLVLRGDGEVTIDDPGSLRTPGRGAYLCPDEACVDRALRGGLKKALRYEGALPGDLRHRLIGRIDGAGTVDPARAWTEGTDGERKGS